MTEKTEDFEKIILDNIHKNPTFFRCEVEGLYPKETEISGKLLSVFLLSDLHEWTGLTSRKNFKIGEINQEKNDTLLLGLLDSIARKGLIEVFRAELASDLSHRDFRFKCWCGTCRRTIGHSNVKIILKRSYNEKPLSKKEIQERLCLTTLSEIVKDVRASRDKSFREMMGPPSDVSLVSQQKEAMEKQKKAMEEEKKYREDIATIASWIREEGEKEPGYPKNP